MRALLIPIQLLAAATLAAQPTVFPLEAASAEGNTSVDSHHGGLPWWANPDQTPGESEFRMQLITDMPSTFNEPIQQLAYRRDGAVLAGFAIQSFGADIEVVMSTSPNTASSASTTFANNLGNDATVVVPRRRVLFGAAQYSGAFPEGFSVSLLLSNPFPYDASKGSLVMEVKHWSNDLMSPLRLTRASRDMDAMENSTEAAWMSPRSPCYNLSNPYTPNIELTPHLSVDPATGKLDFHASRQYAQHHSRGFLIGSTGMVGFGQGFATNLLPPKFLGCGTIDVDLAQQIFFGISGSNEYGQVRWPDQGNFWSVPYAPSFVGFQFWVQELNYDVHTQEYAASAPVLVQTPTYVNGGQPFGIRALYAEGPGSTAANTATLGKLGLGPVIRYN